MSYNTEDELRELRKDLADMALDIDENGIEESAPVAKKLWELAGCNSDLAKMYVQARRLNGDKADEVEDRARELAISFIITGGFDSDDSDLGGDATGDTVQTHLMIAFMRQPEMMDHHEEALMPLPGEREEVKFQVNDMVRTKFHADVRRPIERRPTDIGVVTLVDDSGNLLVRWNDDRTPQVTEADDVTLFSRPTITDHRYDAGHPRDDSRGCIATAQTAKDEDEMPCGKYWYEHAASEYPYPGKYSNQPATREAVSVGLAKPSELVTGTLYRIKFRDISLDLPSEIYGRAHGASFGSLVFLMANENKVTIPESAILEIYPVIG